MERNIYSVGLVPSKNYQFGYLAWVVNGSIGRMSYPGSWAECTVREYYANGWRYNHRREEQK